MTNHFVKTNAAPRSLNSVKLIRRNVPVDVVSFNEKKENYPCLNEKQVLSISSFANLLNNNEINQDNEQDNTDNQGK